MHNCICLADKYEDTHMHLYYTRKHKSLHFGANHCGQTSALNTVLYRIALFAVSLCY